MDYKKLSEESLDVIMEKIRAENNKSSSNNDLKSISFPTPPLTADGDISFKSIESLIADMAVGSRIGLKPSPMHKKRGVKRIVAKIIERVYIRVAELSNRDVRTFCVSATTALRYTNQNMGYIVNRFNAQRQQLETLEKEKSNLFEIVENQEKMINEILKKLKEQ